MKVDDIAERCLEEENDQRLKDIGQQLYALRRRAATGNTSRKNNVSFQNQFTVLELDELQGRKHLRQVVLLQLIYQIQQEVFSVNVTARKSSSWMRPGTCSKRARSRSSWNMPTANSVSTVAPLSLQRSPSTTSMRTQWAAPSGELGQHVLARPNRRNRGIC